MRLLIGWGVDVISLVAEGDQCGDPVELVLENSDSPRDPYQPCRREQR